MLILLKMQLVHVHLELKESVLFRTEHMFYGVNSEEPLFKLRKMILSNTVEERISALNELFPYVKSDMKGTMEAMDGFGVTIRTIDPPLHEFVPTRQDEREKLASSLGISIEALNDREINFMKIIQ